MWAFPLLSFLKTHYGGISAFFLFYSRPLCVRWRFLLLPSLHVMFTRCFFTLCYAIHFFWNIRFDLWAQIQVKDFLQSSLYVPVDCFFSFSVENAIRSFRNIWFDHLWAQIPMKDWKPATWMKLKVNVKLKKFKVPKTGQLPRRILEKSAIQVPNKSLAIVPFYCFLSNW